MRDAEAPRATPKLSLLLIALAVAMTACATPRGAEPDACDASWRSRDPQIVQPGGADERPVAIDCMRAMDRRRLRIGFTLPPGPDCYQLADVEVVESADAVSVTLLVSRRDDPSAGACAEEPQRVRTEIDLQAPVADRRLLDGSRAAGPSGTPAP